MNVKKISRYIYFFVFLCVHSLTHCLYPDALVLQQQLQFDGSVKSVAWDCGTDNTYAAVGGIPDNESDPVVRVYEFNSTLVEFDTIYSFTAVYSVDWCRPYLAVGGTFDDGGVQTGGVQIFENNNGNSMDYVTSYTHGAPIRAVSWLCDCCDGNPVLAIGGETASDGFNIRLLEFDTTDSTLTVLASFSRPAPVNSLDWCCCEDSTPPKKAYLAAGGEIVSCGGTNLGIYLYDCDSSGAYPITSSATTATDLHSVRWCCGPDRVPKLVVGGRPGTSDVNVQIYSLCRNSFFLIASLAVPGTVFAVDWNSFCKCTYITLGTGNLSSPTADNIWVYKLLQNQQICSLELVASTCFDQNITSLAWCAGIQEAHLLVGADSSDYEIALYRSILCTPQYISLCQRSGKS